MTQTLIVINPICYAALGHGAGRSRRRRNGKRPALVRLLIAQVFGSALMNSCLVDCVGFTS